VVFTAEAACAGSSGTDFYVRALINGVEMFPRGGGFQTLESEDTSSTGHAYECVRRVVPATTPSAPSGEPGCRAGPLAPLYAYREKRGGRKGMRVISLVFALFGIPFSMAADAQGEVSIERGLQVSIIGGCHRCHTEGYVEAEGKIDPETALRGIAVGWVGPWGTSYAGNLRLVASGMSERTFVEYLQGMRARPPMPWYALREMDKSDLQSLYQYIKSLGEPGKQVAARNLDPGEEPTTPYIQLVPPQMPNN